MRHRGFENLCLSRRAGQMPGRGHDRLHALRRPERERRRTVRSRDGSLVADPADVPTFRFRGNGWLGRATALTAAGAENGLSCNEFKSGALIKRVQLRCKIYAGGGRMLADLVCADAWHGDERGYPSVEEQEGRSRVLGTYAPGAKR